MPPSAPQLDEHGFPIPPTFDDPLSQRRPSQWLGHTWQVGLVLIFIVLLAGWVFKSGLGEGLNDWIANQLLARAQEKEDFGDFPGALADLERASRWAPNELKIVERRAHAKLKTHDVDGSLADFDQVLRSDRKNASAYMGRSVAYQRLHRHREAVDDLTQAISMLPGDPTALNNRAYARAVGGIELDAALADVQQAIDIIDRELGPEEAVQLDLRSHLQNAWINGRKAAYLDTRGYVYFLQEKYDLALKDFNKAIELSTTWQNVFMGQLRARQAAPQQQAVQRQLDQELSVMYHHRGQVHEKLGRHAEAQSDLDQGEKLGYNPAEGVF
ncbi:MAG TPA: tetratricopeptide repeat protein [Pirellulales bacterium]|nr:tetratricopeptide repeat protein [Pirellulales bacterium]